MYLVSSVLSWTLLIGKFDTWSTKQPSRLSAEQFAAGVDDVLGSNIPTLVGSAACRRATPRREHTRST